MTDTPSPRRPRPRRFMGRAEKTSAKAGLRLTLEQLEKIERCISTVAPELASLDLSKEDNVTLTSGGIKHDMSTDAFLALFDETNQILKMAETASEPMDGAILWRGIINYSLADSLSKRMIRIHDALTDRQTEAWQDAHAAFCTLLTQPNQDPPRKGTVFYYLADIHERGVLTGGHRDVAKAYDLYLQSAENGFALAYDKLGYLCFNGKGVERSVLMAYVWTKRAVSVIDRFAPERTDAIYSNLADLSRQVLHAFNTAPDAPPCCSGRSIVDESAVRAAPIQAYAIN